MWATNTNPKSFRQQDSVVSPREFHQLPIDGSPLHLAHSQNVVAFRTQRSHNREVTAFVGEESHPMDLADVGSEDGFVGDGVGGVR